MEFDGGIAFAAAMMMMMGAVVSVAVAADAVTTMQTKRWMQISMIMLSSVLAMQNADAMANSAMAHDNMMDGHAINHRT